MCTFAVSGVCAFQNLVGTSVYVGHNLPSSPTHTLRVGRGLWWLPKLGVDQSLRPHASICAPCWVNLKTRVNETRAYRLKIEYAGWTATQPIYPTFTRHPFSFCYTFQRCFSREIFFRSSGGTGAAGAASRERWRDAFCLLTTTSRLS